VSGQDNTPQHGMAQSVCLDVTYVLGQGAPFDSPPRSGANRRPSSKLIVFSPPGIFAASQRSINSAVRRLACCAVRAFFVVVLAPIGEKREKVSTIVSTRSLRPRRLRHSYELIKPGFSGISRRSICRRLDCIVLRDVAEEHFSP
jgi:hypothetical protein